MSETLRKQVVARIEQRIADLGMKPRTVSVEAGLGPDLVRDWLRTTSMPRIDSLAHVARVLKTRPEWLAYGVGAADDGSERPAARQVPRISWVAASRFDDVSHVEQLADAEHLTVGDLPGGDYIALHVNGDSMDRVAPDGSTIIVRLNDCDLVSRGFYVFRQGGTATFKRYMTEPDRLEPFSTNVSHEVLPVTACTEVVGRVVRTITRLV